MPSKQNQCMQPASMRVPWARKSKAIFVRKPRLAGAPASASRASRSHSSSERAPRASKSSIIRCSQAALVRRPRCGARSQPNHPAALKGLGSQMPRSPFTSSSARAFLRLVQGSSEAQLHFSPNSVSQRTATRVRHCVVSQVTKRSPDVLRSLGSPAEPFVCRFHPGLSHQTPNPHPHKPTGPHALEWGRGATSAGAGRRRP